MDKKKFEELNEQLLMSISGGGDGNRAYTKKMLDEVVPVYRLMYPETSLDYFLTNVFRKSYPNLHLEARSEEEIEEYREYIAHYWE